MLNNTSPFQPSMNGDDEGGKKNSEETPETETKKEKKFLGGDTGFGQGPTGGKFSSLLSKMGPLLRNKEMFFSILDNAIIPQVDEVLDKYLYGEYQRHKAKFLFSYYTSLTEAGFSQEMAEKLVEIQAEKDSAIKLLFEALPDIIDIITQLSPKRPLDDDEEYL